jgi:positive regulator of sigma E activity
MKRDYGYEAFVLISNLVIVILATALSADLHDPHGMVISVAIFLIIFDVLVYLSYRSRHKKQ